MFLKQKQTRNEKSGLERESLYMFSAHGDPSMASIAYQSARDDDGTSDQASVGPYWTQKKSTEEMLRENEAKKISPKATQSKPTSVSPYGR